VSIDIILTPYEYEVAVYIGLRRQEEAVKKGLKDQHGLEFGSKDPLRCHVEGVAGEIACSRALNIYWRPSVNTFKAPDLLDNLQVKTRGEHYYDLLVRPRDNDNDLFVLVTRSPDPADMLYRVHGYLSGAESKRPEYLKNHGGRAPAYFPPQKVLHSNDDLIAKIILAQAARIGL
jgi:hypothetical protein